MSLKILIDIIHPAHVHFFRNAIKLWQKDHTVLVTSRQKEVTIELLDAYQIEHKCLSKIGSGLLGLAFELVERDWKFYKVAKQFKPDVVTGVAGICPSHIGKILSIPSIVFYDTEFANLSNTMTYPLASVVCTPSCYQGDIGKKHVRYPGYHELAYLHPNRFKATGDKPTTHGNFLLRFVSWGASHDVHEKGISYEDKLRLVKLLEKNGTVHISSEDPLPPELEPYRLKCAIHEIHKFIATTTMVIGESATMASEAAMLGIPAVYIAKSSRGYVDELCDKYSLIERYHHTEFELAYSKIKEVLLHREELEHFQIKREKMLSAKIDVTKFIHDFVLRFPEEGLNAANLILKG